ncbi:efflux RND transporter periplasmic adaptor subunit [Nocardioides sp.]|uniref:efflux RND transporter periplasmic adaptor subunit n=1 Tax=Nocardioides sp. TaxID=35761 RepID=UPI002BD6240E|nr:HlyD family efflux transporter periplasmic adaptor subunit [Nocardioides sp.]HVX53276.1 HlyD family efflux transporter periplasmic adaptor subunit [Nocardioides sp.]
MSIGVSLWRHRAVRVGTGIVVVAALAGGGVAAYAAHGGGPDEYRTAAVAYGDVEQTLALSGTISPTGRADLSFGTAGTVASVKAGVGDHVTHGQVLAKLDTTALSTAVSKANAELAAAKAQLAKDEDAQAAAVTTSDSSTSSTPSKTSQTPSSTPSQSSPSNPTSSSSAALQKALAQLGVQQRAVETAQSAVDDDLAVEQQALDALNGTSSPCQAADSSASSDPSSGDPSGGSSGDPSAMPTGSPTTGPGSRECSDALTAVQKAQQNVRDAEADLDDALTKLAATLTNAAKTAGQSSATQQGGSGGKGGASSQAGKNGKTSQLPTGTASQTSQTKQSTGTSGTATGTGGTGGELSRGTGQTVTAATLAKDQASIDTAKASLVKATQALAGATITAPASGTVAQVSVARGDSASAGSTAIVVIAPGTTTVELSVSDTQVTQVKVGQQARVTPAGASQSYAGSVTRIGALPTTSSTGTSTYPVTVTLDQQGLVLLTGATAAVDVVLGTAKHVLTVPTSAVSDGSVEVYDDGSVSRTRVTTGLVGRSRTVITGGLKLGQQVVLADASSPLPSSASSNTRGGLGTVRFAGGGAVSFGGGGGFGGRGVTLGR